MAWAVSGYSTVAQNFISRGVVSNFYKKAPFLAILGALTLGNQNKNSLEIGRPDTSEILAGARLDPLERKRLGTVNAYLARIQKFVTSNTKGMGTRDTYPTVANPTTNSQGQATQAAAEFHWFDVVTPILIWHEDMIRAEQGSNLQEGQALSMGKVVDDATEIAMQEHIDWLADKIWNGNPADQSADLWNEPAGILQALSATNTYGRVDRNVESLWRAQVDSTFKAVDIRRLIDDANLTKELNVKGNGAGLVLAPKDIYRQYKNQILSQIGLGKVMTDGLPQYAKMGVKAEVLQVDNCYVAYDPQLDAASTSTVCVFDLTTWKFMVHEKRNMKVGKFSDLSQSQEGGKDADQGFIRTRAMFTCDNPFLNVKYTAIGT